MRSNEKSCVCNVFATLYFKNQVKSSLPSSLNVNFSSASDSSSEYVSERTISKKLLLLRTSVLGNFFVCILLQDNGILYIEGIF